jgi:hypothetical protein
MMPTTASRTLASTLVFCALGCGTQPPSEPPATAKPAPPTSADSGRVTVHVKNMTKALGLF